MASRFWTFVSNLIPGQTARSEQVNAKFGEIEEGLDMVAAEMNRSLRITETTSDENALTLDYTAVQRAGKSVGFDALGAVTLLNAGFVWKGDWVAGAFYALNDVVRAPLAQGYSIYLCSSAHTSVDFVSDPWAMMIDLTEARKSLILHQMVIGPQTNYAVVAGQDLMVDVTGGSVSLLLPAAPAILDQPINVMHVAGPIADNPIVIKGNGQKIMGLLEDMTVDTANASFGLAFCDIVNGWRIRGV